MSSGYFEQAFQLWARNAKARPKPDEAPEPKTIWIKLQPHLGEWRTVEELAHLAGLREGSVRSSLISRRDELRSRHRKVPHKPMEWRLRQP